MAHTPPAITARVLVEMGSAAKTPSDRNLLNLYMVSEILSICVGKLVWPVSVFMRK